MKSNLSAQQLASFAVELRNGLSINAVQNLKTLPHFPFGNVRMGSHGGFSKGDPHPYVVVTNDPVPSPHYGVRPGTSVRHSPKDYILRLPPEAIKLKKAFPSGQREYVETYILCNFRLRSSAHDVCGWRYLNDLDPQFHFPLQRCLKAAAEPRKQRHG